jgi:hypothetical protein
VIGASGRNVVCLGVCPIGAGASGRSLTMGVLGVSHWRSAALVEWR